jgi:hypothetical protein
MKTKKTQNHSSKQNLPTIQCECGHKILLIPDVKAMRLAIEEHSLEHKRKYNLTEEQTDTLENILIAQVFELASKQK